MQGVLAQLGAFEPEVIVDTENVVWQADGLAMKAKVFPKDNEKAGDPGKEYSLLVPLMEGGKADYSPVDALAKQMTADWVKAWGGSSDKVLGQIKELLQEVVKAYVQWVIEQTQKDVQEFWDAFSAELQNKLEEVQKYEKEVEQHSDKIRRERLKVAARPDGRPEPGVINGLLWAFPRIWWGLFEAGPIPP